MVPKNSTAEEKRSLESPSRQFAMTVGASWTLMFGIQGPHLTTYASQPAPYTRSCLPRKISYTQLFIFLGTAPMSTLLLWRHRSRGPKPVLTMHTIFTIRSCASTLNVPLACLFTDGAYSGNQSQSISLLQRQRTWSGHSASYTIFVLTGRKKIPKCLPRTDSPV